MYVDPYFNDIPWEIIYDDEGNVIGMVFVLLPKKGHSIARKKPRLQEMDLSGG